MSSFTVQSRLENGILVLRPQGYLEKTAGEALRQEVERSLPRGVNKCIVDFSGVPVINSPGVTMLLELAEVLHYEHRIPLGLAALTELYKEVFQAVGLLDLVQVFPDEAAAIRSL